MKFGPHDLRRLQAGLFVMVLAVALGAAAVVFSRDRIAAAQAAFTAAQGQRNEIDGKLRQVRNEESEIRQKAALFNSLQARGVIGEEPRLEWVELLKEIRDRHRLIEVRYEFAPQHALDKAPAGTLGLYASTMKLQVRLLHEEDLTRLLGDLRRQARALIQVRRCDVARLPRTGADNALQGLLQADCVIDWITVREVDKSKVNAK